MPTVSQSQQKLMGMVYAYKKDGTLPDNKDLVDKIKKMAASMSMDDVKDFASTSHKGLPEGFIRFKQFINEEISPEEMMSKIEKSFKSQFPNGFVVVKKGSGIGEGTISISVGLIGNIADVSNKIRHNDPMLHTWLLFKDPKGYSAEISISGISINPPKDSYLAMGNVKTKWRKTKGDEKKMVTTFDKFFKKLKSLIKEHGDNIYQRSTYNNKYFK